MTYRDLPNGGWGRKCRHFWRRRHPSIFGKHCDQCCNARRGHGVVYLFPHPTKKIGD